MVKAYGTPNLGGRGGRRGSAMAPLERAMAVSYRLSIVTVALSVTIRPRFATKFDFGWGSDTAGELTTLPRPH